MAKYEICITDNTDGSKQFIAADTVSWFSDTLSKGKVVLICESSFHAGGTISQPSFSRQEVRAEIGCSCWACHELRVRDKAKKFYKEHFIEISTEEMIRRIAKKMDTWYADENGFLKIK
jgi:hypothetical protein